MTESRSNISSNAESFLEYFDFDFDDSGMKIIISNDAPPLIHEMILYVCGEISPENLVKVYEALSTLSECEDIECCEIDEKVCEMGVFCKLADYLSKI